MGGRGFSRGAAAAAAPHENPPQPWQEKRFKNLGFWPRSDKAQISSRPQRFEKPDAGTPFLTSIQLLHPTVGSGTGGGALAGVSSHKPQCRRISSTCPAEALAKADHLALMALDEVDDLHRGAALGTGQWIGLVNLLDEGGPAFAGLPGAGRTRRRYAPLRLFRLTDVAVTVVKEILA